MKKACKRPTTTPRDPQMRCQQRPGTTSDGTYVMLGKKRIYLGVWGLEETQTKYDQVMSEWRANGRMYIEHHPDITIMELAVGYLAHCESYYGKDDSAVITATSATAPLASLYGATIAKDFGCRKLKAVRGAIIQQGIDRKRPYTRGGVNRLVGGIRRMFRWAVREELIPVTVATALEMLEPLRKGKCTLKDNPPIQPVERKSLEVIAAHLNTSTKALMWLMYYTGARCAEIVNLKPCDIDRSRTLWEITLATHKTANVTGTPRKIYVGQNGQSAIRKLLLKRKDTEFLFQPGDHFEKVKARSFSPRRPDQKDNPRKTDRGISETYTTTSFRNALGYACKAAGVPKFTPHQLRHSAATNIRGELGLEAAQAVLGHTTVSETQVYALVAEKRAQEAMATLG